MRYSELEKLNDLKEKNIITEEEFESEKRKILEDSHPGANSSGFGKDLFGMELDKYCMFMHLSQFLGIIVPYLGLFASVGLWLTNREKHQEIDRHGKNIVNALISYHIYALLSVLLMFIWIGFVLLPVLGIVYFVSVIIAGLRAGEGKIWEYPMAIRII
ncbi:MAG: DUF4870 domain-containing protein [Cytophagales bacterium]|nr:DUF4870 domain-containing protein [Cytophagales bacterium]